MNKGDSIIITFGKGLKQIRKTILQDEQGNLYVEITRTKSLPNGDAKAYKEKLIYSPKDNSLTPTVGPENNYKIIKQEERNGGIVEEVLREMGIFTIVKNLATKNRSLNRFYDLMISNPEPGIFTNFFDYSQTPEGHKAWREVELQFRKKFEEVQRRKK